jgi:hypothetical protein
MEIVDLAMVASPLAWMHAAMIPQGLAPIRCGSPHCNLGHDQSPRLHVPHQSYHVEHGLRKVGKRSLCSDWPADVGFLVFTSRFYYRHS